MGRSLRPPLLACGLAVLAGAARADTCIGALPDPCRMDVVSCPADPGPKASRVLSSVLVEHRWTTRAYTLSPDGKTLLVPLRDGLRIVRDGRVDDRRLFVGSAPREMRWHPDGRRVAVWIQDTPPGSHRLETWALAVLDVDDSSVQRPVETVLRGVAALEPCGVEWSADGSSLVVRHGRATSFVQSAAIWIASADGVVSIVELSAPPRVYDVAQLKDHPFELALPARSRSSPTAPDAAPPWLLYREDDALVVIDPRGAPPRALPLSLRGAHGLCERSPEGGRSLALVSDRLAVGPPVIGPTRHRLWLVDLDRAHPTTGSAGVELLAAALRIHTISFSPRGRSLSWATPDAVCLREVGATPAETVEVRLPEGSRLIRGFAWSADERRLAITAGNALFVFELATRALRRAATIGSPIDTVLADPTWLGDEVLVAAYVDPARSEGQGERD